MLRFSEVMQTIARFGIRDQCAAFLFAWGYRFL